ncbi:hypothetical protein [Streptomyces sp. NPDC056190]|uniref:hypothetical protein n=1 Tax=Streptomyces sp. NPDC056190 TaxID=3345741 RepID=UPI0035D62BFE
MAKAATTLEEESKRALADALDPMSDEELRAEFERQKDAKPSAKTPAKSVTDVLAQLEAVQDVRLESDGAGVATCGELTPSALQDLFANRTCALHVPGFGNVDTCTELARWLADRPCACRKPRPCRSRGVFVLVEDAAQAFAPAYVEAGDLRWIVDRRGQGV